MWESLSSLAPSSLIHPAGGAGIDSTTLDVKSSLRAVASAVGDDHTEVVRARNKSLEKCILKNVTSDDSRNQSDTGKIMGAWLVISLRGQSNCKSIRHSSNP